MKHKRLTALVLAAALVLAGCGGTKSSSGSAAASQSTGSSQNAPAIAVQKERITEQFTLEKTVRSEWGSAQKLTIHVPQLVCDSPDAEYINNELAAMYAEEYRDYESYPQAEVSQDEWCPQTYIDWDAYWYGDCVSLVVSSYYGGTDPIYSQGWCFDFAAGHKLSVTELLMRMGLDPDETQLAVYRAAIQTFDRNMVQQEYYDSLRESGMLSGMRADTLRDNGLENLTVLLKNENTVTLVAGYHTTAGSGWRPLEVELPLTPAAPAKTPVLTDTYGSVSVLLDGDIRTVTIKHTSEIIAWAEDYDIRLDGDVTLPIRNAYNNYVDVCIGELGASFHPVVYLLTEDGFVEYVDVLRCLLYGQSLLCADPIYIANNGTALALRDAEVSLLCADGTETELAPLTAEWNSLQQVDSTGSFSLGEGENWCWLDLNSGGGCQLATHNNRYFYQGAVTHPERTRETELGNLFADIFTRSLGIDIMLIGSGSIRAEKLGPIVTYGDLIEGFPYDDGVFMFKVTGQQLRQMLHYMLREEAYTGHTEFYQLPSTLRLRYDRAKGDFDYFTYCGKEVGKEIGDDALFTVGLQNYHFKNIESFFNISYETICKLQKPRSVATSCQDILMEYFREHEMVDAAVDGRMTILPSTAQTG